MQQVLKRGECKKFRFNFMLKWFVYCFHTKQNIPNYVHNQPTLRNSSVSSNVHVYIHFQTTLGHLGHVKASHQNKFPCSYSLFCSQQGPYYLKLVKFEQNFSFEILCFKEKSFKDLHCLGLDVNLYSKIVTQFHIYLVCGHSYNLYKFDSNVKASIRKISISA